MQRFAGAKYLDVASSVSGDVFTALAIYPTKARAAPIRFGPYSMDLAVDAPIDASIGAPSDSRGHRLVVISHGTGGTHLGYRTMASSLARRGYIVLMLEHPGNNRNDDSLADTRENLVNRPRHLSLAVDAALADPMLSSALPADSRFAVIGHSLGGYTGLALAGGRPTTRSGERLAIEHDDRVQALVLLAPATPWFDAPGALSRIRVPVLILSGQKDSITPIWHAQLVIDGLPESTEVVHKVVPNAGHFSFMSPFPKELLRSDFAPAGDPPGFDREAFQADLVEEIATFLLASTQQPAEVDGLL